MDIQTLEGKALSGSDIMKALNYRTNIISYPELENYKSLNQIFGPDKSVVILFLTGPNYGHWICIFERNKDTVEFFDPYGIYPDDEKEFISPSKRKEFGEDRSLISNLLYNSHYKNLEYNDGELQAFKEGISDCGRHVISRLMHRNMPINEYIKYVHSFDMSPDDYVTYVTNKLFNI